MATVTKLKAAVSNKNLPILGEDGNLYDYYTGRYSNKLSELGYTLSATERNALQAFIQEGINKGWIEKVKYLMPFIGGESAPITGIVPLIDDVANYALAVDSVDSKLFSYDVYERIKCMGGRSDCSGISVKLPVKTSHFSCPLSFVPFVNVTLTSETIVNGLMGMFTFARDSNNSLRFAMRKGETSRNNYQYGVKADPLSSSSSYSNIAHTGFEDPCNAGILFGRFIDNDSEKYFSRYVCVRGEASAKSVDLKSASSVELPEDSQSFDIYIGSSVSTPILQKINVFALFDPINLTSSDMYSFNQAVFALTTALGR